MKNTLLVVAAALALLWPGCKKDDAESGAKDDSAGARTGGAATSLRDPNALLAKAADRLPAASDLIVVVDVKPVLNHMGDPGFGLIPGVDIKAFRADMSKLYKRFLGLDPMKTDFAVGYVSVENKSAGLLIYGDFGGVTIPGTRKKTVSGVEATELGEGVLIADLDGVLLLGNEAAFADVTAKENRLAGSDRLAEHKAAFEQTGPALVAASVIVVGKLTELIEKSPMAGGEIKQLFGALGAGGNGMMAGIVADEKTRSKVKGMIDAGLAVARSYLEKFAADIDSDSLELAALGVLAKHHGLAALKIPKIADDKTTLTVSVEIGGFSGGAAAVVMVLATSSVVAVPAFIKYMRRAKTTEAIDRLDMIYKSASNYYTSPRVARGTGAKLPCQFPANQKLTPDVTGRSCCAGTNDKDEDDRCDVNIAQWATPTWSALNFQMNDQHYFGYSFESSGTLAAARFTASAHADLDCDGTLSTFQRFGYGDATSSHAECSMKGSSQFYKNNETE